MTRLDEMFTDALQRQATTPSDERLAAVAEVTVHRARRHRRARAALEVVGTLVVVGVGLFVGSTLLGGNATQPAVTPAPSLGGVHVDVRMPQAPAMTEDDWARMDASWDVELASFVNVEASGYTVAAYLIPPDGQRLVAYANSEFQVANPVLLAWDSDTREALILDDETYDLWVLDLRTGLYSNMNQSALGDIVAGGPAGKSTDGKSYFVLAARDAKNVPNEQLYRFEGGAARPVPHADGSSASSLWENMVVQRVNDQFEVLNVQTGDTVSLSVGADCVFVAWTTRGTGKITCGTSADDDLTTVEFDPVTGTSTPTAVIDYFSDPWSAIDGTRLLAGSPSTADRALPRLDNGDGVVIDLGADFTSTPDTYTVIFGTRHE